MDADLRIRVRNRAGDRCEYCGLNQDREPFYRFHIEHIIAKQHGGGDEFENLALSCFNCNVHKGTNLSSIDPLSGKIVSLFNPRSDRWPDHFCSSWCDHCGTDAKRPCNRVSLENERSIS